MYSDDKYFDAEKVVDEALKTPLKIKLSERFADVLAEKMARKFALKQYLVEFLIYFGAIVGLVAVSVAIQFVLFGARWQDWMQFIGPNITLVLGIVFLSVFVLFADRVLLRYFLLKNRPESN
jgi:hypothetical protein